MARRPCRSCTSDFEHCHGLLTVHIDGWIECSAPDCPTADPVLHDARAECGPDGCEVCVVVTVREDWLLAG
jgi:hypothetical protein